MSRLREQYEKITGDKHITDMVEIKQLPTWGYVYWLEARIDRLNESNKIYPCTSRGDSVLGMRIKEICCCTRCNGSGLKP